MNMSSTKILRNAHGDAVGVVPGKKELPYKKDKLPHATACRMDSPPTSWIIDHTEEEKKGIRLSYSRKGSAEYLFPHWGCVKEGQRLATAPSDSNLPNRYFLLTKLSSGGFYLSSHVDPTLYVGISDDGYLSFVKDAYPWFLT